MDLENQLKKADSMSPAEYIVERHRELENFLNILKSISSEATSEGTKDIDLELFKIVLAEYGKNYSFLIAEKALFENALKQADIIREEKYLKYYALAVKQDDLKAKTIQKWKIENWIKTNTDYSKYLKECQGKQTIIDVLKEWQSVFRHFDSVLGSLSSLIKYEGDRKSVV